MIKKIFFITSVLLFCSFVYAAEQKQKTEIVGDKMIIKDKGQIAYFKGHANVKRGNYNITSNEMTYYRTTDDVDAKGNVNKISGFIFSALQIFIRVYRFGIFLPASIQLI